MAPIVEQAVVGLRCPLVITGGAARTRETEQSVAAIGCELQCSLVRGDGVFRPPGLQPRLPQQLLQAQR